jgi:hypothetical protein
MPARNVPRCRRKSSIELGLIEELNCVYWTPLLPGSQFKSLAAMRETWERHRDDILPHYIRQRPGTRPFAMYALGELPLPPLKHEPTPYALQTVIDGRTIYCSWYYFGTRTGRGGYYHGGSSWGEFQYLRRLGVIDCAEAKRAAEWIDDRYDAPGRECGNYVPLSAE